CGEPWIGFEAASLAGPLARCAATKTPGDEPDEEQRADGERDGRSREAAQGLARRAPEVAQRGSDGAEDRAGEAGLALDAERRVAALPGRGVERGPAAVLVSLHP